MEEREDPYPVLAEDDEVLLVLVGREDADRPRRRVLAKPEPARLADRLERGARRDVLEVERDGLLPGGLARDNVERRDLGEEPEHVETLASGTRAGRGASRSDRCPARRPASRRERRGEGGEPGAHEGLIGPTMTWPREPASMLGARGLERHHPEHGAPPRDREADGVALADDVDPLAEDLNEGERSLARGST